MATLRVLHVEVGGHYGGSVRGLEVYLAHTSALNAEHDVLFYYPTAGAERLTPSVGRILTLYKTSPISIAEHLAPSRLRMKLRKLAERPLLYDILEWCRLVASIRTVIRIARVLRFGRY